MMDKKKLPIIIVIILLLLVGGWYFLTQKKTSGSESNKNNDTNKEESISTNLKDLFLKGTAQTCRFSSDEGKGVVYVSAGNMRGDFETNVEERLMKSHMIVKDNKSYIWTDDEKTGLSMAFDPNTVSQQNPSNPTTQSEAADLTANYDYKCSAWITDNSKFTPPTDITFSSFDIPKTNTQVAPQQGDSTGSSQCSYCNALTGDDKAQCLKALNCN